MMASAKRCRGMGVDVEDIVSNMCGVVRGALCLSDRGYSRWEMVRRKTVCV